MNTLTPPLVREHLRSADDIADQAARRLAQSGFSPAGADPLRDALIQVFARYGELLVERLNRVPETHHAAFLDLLGAAPAPAVPARVALSFKAVPGAAIEWGIQTEAEFTALEPARDTTEGLTRSGELILLPPEKWPSQAIDGVESRWLTCRAHSGRSAGRITGLWISACAGVEAVPVEGACHGPIPLDVSQDWCSILALLLRMGRWRDGC